MVYGFVKQSRGHVQMFSEPGRGATVKIYLPRSLEPLHEQAPAPVGALQGAAEVILVVEDDDLVRAWAVGILREHGFTCIHASDGAAALKILAGGAKVDLLFTDVVMPGPVSCRELAREAQAIRPGMPVLYTSGYAEDAIVHDGRVDEGVQLLSKPYDRETLARRISAMLKAARPVVLVVEDDPLVRMAAVDMVEALGFTPLQAGDAPAAMEILNRRQPVDVLFTDVGLPGVRGTELAQQARALRPSLKVIFASGYGDVADEDDSLDAAHLRKPYEQDQLAEALASAVS
jgi:CheY-like chemotaxis protein